MTDIKIEGFASNEYSYFYQKVIENSNEAKYYLKLNFLSSFNTTPTLTLSFN